MEYNKTVEKADESVKALLLLEISNCNKWLKMMKLSKKVLAY